MTIKLKGDFRKALGFETIKLSDEIQFELTNVSPKEVKDFQELFFNNGKDLTDTKNLDKFRNYFIDFITRHNDGNSIGQEEIQMLVTMYLMKLFEQFSISFKLLDKDKLEEARLRAEISEKKKSPSN
jgi:hypothetical protein